MSAVPPARAAAVFDLELSDAPDALLRVLDLFAVQGARFSDVRMRRVEARLALRVEVEDLTAERRDRLQGRLGACLFVRSLERVPDAPGSPRLQASELRLLADAEAGRPTRPPPQTAYQARNDIKEEGQNDEGQQSRRQTADRRHLSHA